MVSRLAAASLALLFSTSIATAHATPADCSERLLPPSFGAATGKRPITARDLVELRDFGRPDSGALGEPFNVSPDGRFAALTLRRGDPDTDTYCIGVVLVRLDGSAPPRLLDVGGQAIPYSWDLHGVPAIPSGTLKAATPVWSPDGKWLAWLRRDGDFTQVWRVGLDGRPAEQMTHLSTEILSVSWSGDGRALLFTTHKALDEGIAAIDREGRRGFLYDERFWAMTYDRPRPRLPLPVETSVLDIATGMVRPIPAGLVAATRGGEAVTRPAQASLFAASPIGAIAWVAPEDRSRPFAPDLLRIEADGRRVPCAVEFCRQRIAGLWWRGRRELLILRDGSAGNGGRYALFRWRVGIDRLPRKLFDTVDSLTGCQLLATALLCAHETATRPRVLARVAIDSGRMATVYDPNPEFAQIRFGKVERLIWTDRAGVTAFGDLVLPPTHAPGERHPLIIVQYQSRGFLRGGTGDDYPIHLLAERGYAVLSFQKPEHLPETEAASDANAMQRINVRDWAERRRIFTSLDAGIDAVIARGVADPDRIGITGLSDGASTVQFALIHSTRFKAAAVSSCCDDPSIMFTAGPSYAASASAWGYPAAGEDGRNFWRDQSLAVNADRIRTPLLMQLPDGEYRIAAEGFSALKAQGAPVEMVVFPDEHHVKWHPAHRLAVYRRGTAWLDFWLRDLRSDDPELRDELARWQAMRQRAAQARR